MITIVLTNRNRNLSLVKNCLESLFHQKNKDFKCVIVDYGSKDSYIGEFQKVLIKYLGFQLISCRTSGQLWCKSKAINIALKRCKTPYFFVGDIDMIYHPNFTEALHENKNKGLATYFQVGFLSKEESQRKIFFDDYTISFKSNEEATGMTLYDAEVLMSINGYDEFYNGWGSEDTDVHVRLRNTGKKVSFYDDNVLILHQWHPKTYRSKASLAPFHSSLEKINQKYLKYTEESQKIKANTTFEWGYYNLNDYETLNSIDSEYVITNELADVKGFLSNVLLSTKDKVISVSINNHIEYRSLQHIVKSVLGKKVNTFLPMQKVNDIVLECIITNLRNSAYQYTFNDRLSKINLLIKL